MTEIYFWGLGAVGIAWALFTTFHLVEWREAVNKVTGATSIYYGETKTGWIKKAAVRANKLRNAIMTVFAVPLWPLILPALILTGLYKLGRKLSAEYSKSKTGEW